MSLQILFFFIGFKQEFYFKNYVQAISWYELVLKNYSKYEECLCSEAKCRNEINPCGDGCASCSHTDSNASLMARARLAFLYSHSRPGTVLNLVSADHHKKYLKKYYLKRINDHLVDWIQMAAERGVKEAEYCLALNLYNGIGCIDRNFNLAYQWALKAASKGLALAQNLIGNMYIEGTCPGGKNPELGMSWYIQASEQQEPTAVYNIGTLFERGVGVGQNLGEAIEWFERAAKLGSVHAHSVLGILHHRGLIPATHPTKAFYHYKQASHQGHPQSLHNLGRCFQEGFGCERNSKQAYFCFLAAAKQYHSKSMLCVAICHEFGLGVEKHRMEAIEWYIKAAENGQDEARLRLIPIYTSRIVNATKAIMFPPSLHQKLSTKQKHINIPTIYSLPRELQLHIIESLNQPKILDASELSELREGIIDDLKNGLDRIHIQIQEMEIAIERVLAKACACPTEQCDRLLHYLVGFRNLEYCS